MNTTLSRFLILLLLVSILPLSCKKDSADNTGSPSTERDRAVADYREMYLASTVTGFAWNGSTSGCDKGSLPAEVLDKALLRIKYFRKISGLPTNITFDTANNRKTQEYALMIKSNNQINHFPPATWSCYTADGAEAAKNSNIAIGTSDVKNIDQWIQDAGTGNEKAGHRRWLNYSRASKMGFGCTNTSGTVWVINGGSITPIPAGTPEFISWPPKGFLPQNFAFPRWSFSLPYKSYPFKVDFTNASVTMQDAGGGIINLNVISRDAISSSYVGDNSIVWEPVGIIINSAGDIKYHVSISNVLVNDTAKNYSYDVTLIKP